MYSKSELRYRVTSRTYVILQFYSHVTPFLIKNIRSSEYSYRT